MNTATRTIVSNPLDVYQYFLDNFTKLNAAEGFVLILKNQEIHSTISLPNLNRSIIANALTHDADGLMLVEIAPTPKHYFLQQFKELKLAGMPVDVAASNYFRIEDGEIYDIAWSNDD